MPEPEKRFTVFISCESEQFQGAFFAKEIIDILHNIAGNVATNRISGAIIGKNGQTIGNWATQWRDDDPADRRPGRGKRQAR
jgi:hypothetical protein